MREKKEEEDEEKEEGGQINTAPTPMNKDIQIHLHNQTRMLSQKGKKSN